MQISEQIVDPARRAHETWRPGVLTRMRVSALTGACQLCLFEQWCEPGRGAPTHLHAVEEVLTVLDGEAEVWLEGAQGVLSSGQSLLVPAGRKHGFRNIGAGTLHVQATLAAPIFEAAFEDAHEVSRRWLPASAPIAATAAGPQPR